MNDNIKLRKYRKPDEMTDTEQQIIKALLRMLKQGVALFEKILKGERID